MGGVDAQVHDDLMDLGRIGQDQESDGIERLADLDARRQGRLQEFHGFLHDARHFHEAPRLLLRAAERNDLLDELPAPVRRFDDEVQVARGRAVLGGVERSDLGIDEDRNEDVIEIVGDAAGQSAESVDLLGAADDVVPFLDLGGPLPHELFQFLGRPAQDFWARLCSVRSMATDNAAQTCPAWSKRGAKWVRTTPC